MPNGYFFEDQAYPEQDPMAAARAMGLPPGFGMGQQASYDPAELVNYYLSLGGNYNPYQGYPNKLIPDQLMDLVGPTPDYLLPQLYNIQNPDAGQFDLDAFFQANPTIQGPLAEAYTRAEGDPIRIFSELQSEEPIETRNAKGETTFQPSVRQRLQQDVGREEWAQLAEQGHLPIIRAVNAGASPQELDQIAMDYYTNELEGLLAAGSPTTQRAESQLDYTRQREGFRPAPGTGQPSPEYSGPGFGAGLGGGLQGFEDGSAILPGGSVLDAETGQVRDPLAELAGSPQYGGAGQIVREDEGGFWVRPGGSPGDFSAPGKRAAQLLRSGRYLNQDAMGGGRSGRNRGGEPSSGGGRRSQADVAGEYGGPLGRLGVNLFNFFRGGRDNDFSGLQNYVSGRRSGGNSRGAYVNPYTFATYPRR